MRYIIITLVDCDCDNENTEPRMHVEMSIFPSHDSADDALVRDVMVRDFKMRGYRADEIRESTYMPGFTIADSYAA